MNAKPVESSQEGALPSLDASEVLGAPVARVKSKTNVGKFMVLAIILVAFLFIIVGLLFWQKHKQKTAENQPIVAGQPVATKTPGFATRNAPVEDAGIDKQKAELKKQDEEDKRRIKEVETAQAAAAEQDAQQKGKFGKQGPGGQQGQGQGQQQGGGYQGGQAGQSGQGGAPGAATSAPVERKSGVLLELTGAKPKNGESQVTEKDQREWVKQEYATRMAAVNAQTASTATRTAMTQAGQSGGDGMAGRLQPTVLQARSAGRLPNLDYLLKRGTTIPCALQTGIDTTLPGFVICKVLNDVYSANHKVLLVERGATVFGEQQSGLKQGQERTFVLWTRIDNPSGVFADIDSPATDQMGYSGIPGYVDTHFWARFGGAIMLSLIKDFSAAAAQKMSGASGSNAVQNTQAATQDMASEALKNSINIPPNLTVLPGTVVNVMVARDVSFENVYALVE